VVAEPDAGIRRHLLAHSDLDDRLPAGRRDHHPIVEYLGRLLGRALGGGGDNNRPRSLGAGGGGLLAKC
jgi:hypothetical protein